MGQECTNRNETNASPPQPEQPRELIVCVAKANEGHDQIADTAPETDCEATEYNAGVAQEKSHYANVENDKSQCVHFERRFII
jgi:hypothetical protein